MPAGQLAPEHVPGLAQAIHSYLAYRMDETRRRLRFFFRDGPIRRRHQLFAKLAKISVVIRPV